MTKNYILLVFIASVLFSCAKQTSPTGGPKDEIPPKLIESSPENQSLNFSSDEIILEFDEDIRLDNPTNQIIITPRVSQEIKYSAKRNKVIIELEKPLEDNTTYNFNFRNAIKDITEGNNSELSFAFSTGPFLDSLKLSGVIENTLRSNPLQGMTVALQIPMDTAYYFEHPALYFTTTDKEGKFTFNNLKATTYRLYAFNDRNNDLILQPSQERYGFLPGIIALKKDSADIILKTVSTNLDTLKIISDRQSGKYYNVNLNKPVIEYSATAVTKQLPHKLSDDFKAIIFYNIDQLTSPTNHRVIATDSAGFSVEQVVSINYETTRRSPVDFTMKTSSVNIYKENPSVNTTVTFNKPIKDLLYDSIFYQQDSARIVQITKDNINFDSSRSILNINLDLPQSLFVINKPDGEGEIKKLSRSGKFGPRLYFGKNAFISVENDSTEKKEIKPKIYTQDQLAILLLNIDTSLENFIVEILDNKYNVERRYFNQKNLRVDRLIPGDYFIRIIEDKNNNKRWDAGNIYKNTTPEPIYYFENREGGKAQVLRANWEVAVDINIPPVENNVE